MFFFYKDFFYIKLKIEKNCWVLKIFGKWFGLWEIGYIKNVNDVVWKICINNILDINSLLVSDKGLEYDDSVIKWMNF